MSLSWSSPEEDKEEHLEQEIDIVDQPTAEPSLVIDSPQSYQSEEVAVSSSSLASSLASSSLASSEDDEISLDVDSNDRIEIGDEERDEERGEERDEERDEEEEGYGLQLAEIPQPNVTRRSFRRRRFYMSSDASQQEVQQVEIQQIIEEEESESDSWNFKRPTKPSIIPKPNLPPKKKRRYRY